MPQPKKASKKFEAFLFIIKAFVIKLLPSGIYLYLCSMKKAAYFFLIYFIWMPMFYNAQNLITPKYIQDSLSNKQKVVRKSILIGATSIYTG